MTAIFFSSGDTIAIKFRTSPHLPGSYYLFLQLVWPQKDYFCCNSDIDVEEKRRDDGSEGELFPSNHFWLLKKVLSISNQISLFWSFYDNKWPSQNSIWCILGKYEVRGIRPPITLNIKKGIRTSDYQSSVPTYSVGNLLQFWRHNRHKIPYIAHLPQSYYLFLRLAWPQTIFWW